MWGRGEEGVCTGCEGEMDGVYLLICVYGLWCVLRVCRFLCVNLAVMRVRLGYLFSTHVWMFYRENRCRVSLNALCLRQMCVCVCVSEIDRKKERDEDTGAFTAVPKTRGPQ